MFKRRYAPNSAHEREIVIAEGEDFRILYDRETKDFAAEFRGRLVGWRPTEAEAHQLIRAVRYKSSPSASPSPVGFSVVPVPNTVTTPRINKEESVVTTPVCGKETLLAALAALRRAGFSREQARALGARFRNDDWARAARLKVEE